MARFRTLSCQQAKWTFLYSRRRKLVSDSLSFLDSYKLKLSFPAWKLKFPIHRIIHVCVCAWLVTVWTNVGNFLLGNENWTRSRHSRKRNSFWSKLLHQQMVLSVIFNAGAVPLSLEEQIHYYPSSSTSNQSSSAAQSSSSPVNPEYVRDLEELVVELSGVFATYIHQNPPPSSPISLADMYHQRTNTCRSSPSGK